MSSSSSPPSAARPPGAFRLLWSHYLPAKPCGLALARERGWVLAWDANHWICLLNRGGERQAQWRPPDRLVMACCAEDGSAYAAVGGKGEVWWLAPDLMPRWEQSVAHPALACALDPFGQYLAVSDARGFIHIFDRQSRTVCRLQGPRPLYHLAFVPAVASLVCCADFGLVAALDLKGNWLWRDGLVANVGAMAVS